MKICKYVFDNKTGKFKLLGEGDEVLGEVETIEEAENKIGENIESLNG